MTQPNYNSGGYLGSPTLGAEALNQPANYRSAANSQDPIEFIPPPHDFPSYTFAHQQLAVPHEPAPVNPQPAQETFSLRQLAAETSRVAGVTIFVIGMAGFLVSGGDSLQHSLKARGLHEASPFINPDERKAYLRLRNDHADKAKESLAPMFYSLGGLVVGVGGIALSDLLSRRKKPEPKPKLPLHTSPPTP